MMGQSATLREGVLLAAAPQLDDANFAKAVVLLCELNEDGALGLILNRPSDSPVADYLPQWTACEPQVVFVGGPVQPEVAVGLMRHAGETPIGFSVVADADGLFDLATPSELVTGAFELLRVFSGYAGWGPGQLEAELAAGDWLILDAEPADAFTPEPLDLWSNVLRRQGGELGLLSTLPDDPRLN